MIKRMITNLLEVFPLKLELNGKIKFEYCGKKIPISTFFLDATTCTVLITQTF